MSIFLKTLSGEKTATPPLWLMRQAGRYLPEYKAVRAQGNGFLDLVYDPVRAAEVTLQPLRRFDFDAAIIFSDILVVPHLMGADVRFVAGEGPEIAPVNTRTALDQLIPVPMHGQSVAEAVSTARAQMNREGFNNTPLIGFAGAPFTVACYMIQGNGRNHDFPNVLHVAQSDPEFFSKVLDRITEATIPYLVAQVQAGAAALQLFDSWAGIIPPSKIDDWVIKPTRLIVQGIRAAGTNVPIIGFARGLKDLALYQAATGVQAVGITQGQDLTAARASLPPHIATQGNIDPAVLVMGGAALDRAIDEVLEITRMYPHVINLGHGILPETPVNHVIQLANRVRGLS